MTFVKQLLLFSQLFIFIQLSFAQNQKEIKAFRLENPIKMDGLLTEIDWNNADSATNFFQIEPFYGGKISQPTSVKILYDNEAIYVGAFCYDSAPDSILKQLGNRDDDINADLFCVQFDTYNQAFDAYSFQVSSSGVQSEWREQDYSFNAVWESKVSINAKGWSIEIRIPYSAIRFPNQDIQQWGVNFYRHLRRFRENTKWSPAVQGAENDLLYWGKLTELKGIKPPIRLNFYPYVSFSAEHYPANIQNQSNWSYSYNGGMDLKYGLNQSFTLDLTLLPDFTQVQSDNKVKNLSAFETVYSEQRSFFSEAVDLFSRNGLFYSRRIGQTPRFFYQAAQLEDSTHFLVDNPAQVQLLNAFKISGRTTKGLALGIFNALTNEANALLNTTDGTSKKILTDPFSNYNILVIDKSFGKGSSFYLMQTSVVRKGIYRDALAWGGGLNLLDKNNNWGVKSQGSYTYRSSETNPYYSLEKKQGYSYSATLGKFSGKLKYYILYSSVSEKFDANDLGLTFETNQNTKQAFLRYTIFDPFWKILDFNNSIIINNTTNSKSGKNYNTDIQYNANATTNKHLSLWGTIKLSPFDRYDYYEARLKNSFFIRPGYWYFNQGFSSDYRHPFALDGSISYTGDFNAKTIWSFWLKPILRVNNHLNLSIDFRLNNTANDKGFVKYLNDSTSIFGNRKINTFETNFNAVYLFKNNLSLSLNARNYWSGGEYNRFYILNPYGRLDSYSLSSNEDFVFHTLNVDLNFNWEFSPGSKIIITWKNFIIRDEMLYQPDYFETFNSLYAFPQQNVFSMKLMYYLDYFTAKSRVAKRRMHT